MEHKTIIHADEDKQELLITRDFDLPVDLLFKAYAEPSLVEQWMGTKVMKMESKKHGSFQYETRDGAGNLLFKANGAIHEFDPNQKITRTFEMENTPFGVQLEIYKFEKITEERSRLHMQVIFESVAKRDQLLQLPFKGGLNMAHNRLENLLTKFK